jgi:hypothetical protein
MNDFKQSIEMQDPTTNTRLPSTPPGRKVVIGLLGVLIVSVMITWLGFLGWGAIATAQWILCWVKSLWVFLNL